MIRLIPPAIGEMRIVIKNRNGRVGQDVLILSSSEIEKDVHQVIFLDSNRFGTGVVVPFAAAFQSVGKYDTVLCQVPAHI